MNGIETFISANNTDAQGEGEIFFLNFIFKMVLLNGFVMLEKWKK